MHNRATELARDLEAFVARAQLSPEVPLDSRTASSLLEGR